MNRAVVIAVVVVAALTVFSTSTRAHGGEDHGAPPMPAATGDSNWRSASTSTSSVEIVARWAAAPAGAPVIVRVLLSDFETNAPVEGANVTLVISEPQGTSLPAATLQATPSPGIYEATVIARVDAVHAASVTVVAGELVDSAVLSAMLFGAPVVAAVAAHDHDTPLAVIVLSAVLAVVLLAVLIAWLRRRRKHLAAVVPTAAFVIAFGCAHDAHAHGGEDHGDEGGGAVVAAGAMSSSAVILQKESQFLLGIRTARAVNAPVADRLDVPGVVTAPPDRHAGIFAPQQSRVVVGDGGAAIPLLGSVVKKGQVLAVLEAAIGVGDRANFSVQAAQAEAEVASSRSRILFAERNVARLEGLQGVVSQRERDDATVALTQANAALQAAEGKLAAYGSTPRSTRIVLQAPLTGVLADINISPGELVEAGRRAFLIVDGAELWVEARIYEAELGRMTMGASANITVDAWPDEVFAGVLLALGDSIDPATRTVKAIFRVDNPQRRLKLGMFARVQIGTGATSDVLVVPQSAILDVDGRHVIFVHTAPELFERREVAVGRRDGVRVEVRGDVQAGDRVVTSGLLTLKSAPAAPLPAPATAAATSATSAAPTAAAAK